VSAPGDWPHSSHSSMSTTMDGRAPGLQAACSRTAAHARIEIVELATGVFDEPDVQGVMLVLHARIRRQLGKGSAEELWRLGHCVRGDLVLDTQDSPASAPTVVPTGGNTPAIGVDATPAPLPTVSPEQAAEIAAAYRKYFEVTSEALLNLDPSLLDEVAAGESLAGLARDFEHDRALGRALLNSVEHDFYVLRVQGDQADIADR